MPGGKSKFNMNWLQESDGQGNIIGQWCQKKSESSGYCFICNKDVPCQNAGIKQIQQHAAGKKHLDLIRIVQNKVQTKLTFQKPLSKESTGLIVESHSDKVTKAEIIWVLKTAQSDFSYASCDDVVETFKEMFGGPIADDMSLSGRKVSYVVSDGLGPHFLSKLITDVKMSGFGYTIAYDETPNSQTKNQLDIHIRYWSHSADQVSNRYLKTMMLGHAYAETVSKALLSTLDECGLPLSKCIALSSDGPNVTKAVWRHTNESLVEASQPGLVDISTCNLHVIHNSFGKGISVYGEDVEELAIDVFNWFKSGARREDYMAIQDCLDLAEHTFLRHVECRWLSLLPVIERLIEQFTGLSKYFLELPKKDKQVENNARYIRIRRKLQAKDMLVKMCFLQSTASLFQGFLKLFQTEGPLIHVLYHRLSELVTQVLLRFLKPEVVSEKDGDELIAINVADSSNQLSFSNMEIGDPTRKQLNKLQHDQRKIPLRDMQKFYIVVSEYMLKKLPFNNQLLKDLSCLHPAMKNETSTVGAIRRIGRKLQHVVSDHEISSVTDEWKLYQAQDVPKNWSEDNFGKPIRVDHYWRSVLALKTTTGDTMFSTLPKVIKSALSLAHGNADLERGFSVSKKMLTKDRTQLSTASVNGLRVIKDTLRSKNVKAHELVISRKMIAVTRHAHENYRRRLLEEKEEQSREKRLAEDKEAEDTEKSKAREKEQRQVSKEKEDLEKQELSLQEREKDCLQTLTVSQNMFSESSEKLAKALKEKDFTQLSIAQAMIDSAKVKMEAANQELEGLRNEKICLSSLKRKLIDKLSKDCKKPKRD